MGAIEAAIALRFLRLFAAKLPWLGIPQTSEVSRKRAHRGDRAIRIRAWRL